MKSIENKSAKFLFATAVICMMLLCGLILFSDGDMMVASADVNAKLDFYQGKYDNYTDSDIFSYNNNSYTLVSYPSSNLLSTGNLSITSDSNASGGFMANVTGDNAITQIVPKELFLTNGDYTYVGREYGFYINTTDYAPFGNKQSTVMVFDIITDNIGLDTNAAIVEVKVKPLFQRKFVYLNPINSQFRFANRLDGEQTQYASYNISGEGYVVPSVNLIFNNTTQVMQTQFVGDVQEYYIKDISFVMMLLNEQDPNEGYGANYYDPYADTGSYFTYFDYKYDGTARRNGEFPQEEHDAFAKETVNVVLSACELIPVVGEVFEVINLGLKITDQVGMGIDFAVGMDNWMSEEDVDVSNGKITATNYYTNRDDQIEAYGKIVKAVGTIINSTDEGDSIWYKTGDHASGYFQIGHSALNNQHKNLTRLTRQIGLKVVKIDGTDVDTAIGSYNYMLREPQYKTVNIERDTYLYLLDNGTNYFAFTSQYTSDYKFIFDTAAEIELSINGTKQEGYLQDNKRIFEARLYGGHDYSFTVSNGSELIVAPFRIETCADMENINLDNDEYVVKLYGNGMKRISVGGGAQIVAVKALNDAGQLINNSEVSSDLMTSSIDIMMDGECYLILQSDREINTSITYSSVPTISLSKNGTNELNIPFSTTAGMKYVQFTAESETKGYVFTLCNTNGSGIDVGANYRIYKPNGTRVGNMYPIAVGSYYVSLPGGKYYIGFDVDSNVTATLKVELSDIAFKWQVEYIDASGKSTDIAIATGQDTLIDKVTLPLLSVESKYKFTLWINDDISVSNYYIKEVNNKYFRHEISGLVHIKPQCELGTTFRVEGTVPDNVHATFKHRIDATVKFVMDEFAFNETVDYENAMAFSWTNQPMVQGYKFGIYHGADDPIIKTIENSSITKLDVLSDLLAKYATEANVQLEQIKVNGSYSDVTDANKIVFNGKKTLDLNCMYSRIETRRVLLIFTVKDYYIANELHLYNIRKDQSYSRYLDNDINLTKQWTPISTLTCSIYGKGHKIKNLSFYIGSGVPSPTNIGLVGVNNATISNLTIDGISMNGAEGQHFEPWYYIGAIAGVNEGTISSCKVTGSMTVHRAYSTLGGIAGKNSGTIRSCYFGLLSSSRSYLYGNGDVGGIAGQNTGTIDSCYTENTDIRHYVVHASRSVGGIAGYCSGGKILSSAVHNINISNANPDPVTNAGIAPKMGMIVGHIEDGFIEAVGMSNSTHGYGGLTFVTRVNSFNGNWPFYGLMTNTQVDNNLNQNGP